MMVQFLKCEITCSIIQRILLTSELYSFCQSSSSPPAGFLKGVIMLFSDVSFVADPVPRVNRQQYAGFFPAIIIVAAPVDRIGNPGELSVNGAGELEVHSGGLVLP